MNKKLVILIVLGVLLISSVYFFKLGNIGTNALWEISNNGKWLFPLVLVSALIDSINPCAFSILILTIAFLFSIGRLRSRILEIGSFYVLGIFLVYLLIGLGLLQTLHIFNTPHFMAKIGSSFLIAFGLINIAGGIFPRFPVKLKIPNAAHRAMAELMEKGSLPAAFFLGALVGLCEFPCTGGPYLMVLGLLHDQTTFLQGFGYLLFYNLLFILPLVIILFIASEKSLVQKVQSWQQKESSLMRFGTSFAMILLGILILIL